MAVPRRSNGGRRSKGPRRLLGTRPPDDLADLVVEAADADGVSISDWLVQVIAEKLSYPLPENIDPTQGQLPIGA